MVFMIIDCHVHLVSEEGYIDKLIAEIDKLKIDRICLLAMQNIRFWGSRAATNDQVLAAFRKHPDRVIPFAYVDLGVDPVTLIDECAMKGFKGLKFTRTRYPYNDDRLMPYYERAAAYGMVLLFHTGTVLRVEEDMYYDVDSSRLRPVYLDRVARRFPTLKIIGAHLGNPWYEEAAMTLFWNPNVYFDLSGTTLARKDAAWFNEVLWWTPERMAKLAGSPDTHYAKSSPFDRICFGSDVPIPEMGSCLKAYQRLFDALHLPEEVRRRVMGESVAAMFGLKG
jgi:predicted TIM-barrel fold metal-dependent hydrolase